MENGTYPDETPHFAGVSCGSMLFVSASFLESFAWIINHVPINYVHWILVKLRPCKRAIKAPVQTSLVRLCGWSFRCLHMRYVSTSYELANYNIYVVFRLIATNHHSNNVSVWKSDMFGGKTWTMCDHNIEFWNVFQQALSTVWFKPDLATSGQSNGRSGFNLISLTHRRFGMFSCDLGRIY